MIENRRMEFSHITSYQARLYADCYHIVPALVTVFPFQFVANWNNFFLPLIVLNRNDLFSVTMIGLYVYAWHGQAGASRDIVSLVVTELLMASLLLVIFCALQRYWRAGATVGLVKG